MQIAIIEFSRNVLKLKNANSTEFNIKTKYPVIGLVTEWKDASGKIEHRDENSNLGGTMRLGGQKCLIKKFSLSHKLYKKLTITAPNAKGEAPKDDAPLEEKVLFTIVTEVNPSLASHGGFVDLVEITKKNEVVLNFGGGCQGCSSVNLTLKDGVEKQLKALYTEISAVLDATDHSYKENAYM